LDAGRKTSEKMAANTEAELGTLNEASIAVEIDSASEVLASLL